MADRCEIVTGTLRMLGDRLLIKPLDWRPSHVLDVVTNRRPFSGRVVAAGPGKYPKRRTPTNDPKVTRLTLRNRYQPTEVRVGDVVELGGLNVFDGQGYQFPEVTLNGERHLIISEQDVCGVREPEYVSCVSGETFDAMCAHG